MILGMKRSNKLLTWVIGVFLNMAVLIQSAWAKEFVPQKVGLDVIFVMDHSGSMRSNDPDHIAPGMVKAFIDTVHPADIRIGFVAYNDQLLTTSWPLDVKTEEERSTLKALLDKAGYSGNTDIGLGLRYAYDLIGQDDDRRKAIILISDGESDLKGSVTGRVLEDALQDIEYVTAECEKKDIPIYSIAFGEYDGNAEALEKISIRTGGRMYTVERPETLIEVLYGIFEDRIDHRIEKIADGIYGAGRQDILVKLDEPYVDELDVLLISSHVIGSAGVLYGEQEVEAVDLKNYAVAKLDDIDGQVKELVVRTETAANQELQVYLIAYRDLTPVLSVETSADKNSSLAYQVYFKDKDGEPITDAAFYDRFSYAFLLSGNGGTETLKAEIQNGMIGGEILPKGSGVYCLEGRLGDHMGKVAFPEVEIQVRNHCPEGGLPASGAYTVLSKEQIIPLNAYFFDPDGDEIRYRLKDSEDTFVKTEIRDGELILDPVKPGSQTVLLLVSDGEDVYEYPYTIQVIPLWRAYGWVVAIAMAAFLAFLWRAMRKPKPELERLGEETKKNHFAGKLDAYFTVQPEKEEEIPPLSFPMYKVKDNKLCLGDLLKGYPEACDALGLDEVFLIAAEDRCMILYHASKASVMVGNSILCRQIQYHISFGDVIYITSEDRAYDLEIHYIAVIQ